ncbi:MAG: exonuclease domain-containing protein [Nitrososphaeraceae archaeon]|nr:exonuclease domain-containing protein [Nitrososphaeraceae archaeon]
MVKYLSIDIETGGLDPKEYSLLEVAMVYYNSDEPNSLYKHISHHIKEDVYRISQYCLEMHTNNHLLETLAKNAVLYAHQAESLFINFIEEHTKDEKFIVIGKNFGAFDYQWLKIYMPNLAKKLGYRFLDIGSLFLTSQDMEIPNSDECLKRAGRKHSINHTALSDAIDIMDLALFKLN